MGSEMCIRDSDRHRSGAGALLGGGGQRHSRRSVDGGDDADRAQSCLLYTSDAADERSSVDLGGRRIIKKKNKG